MINPFITLDYLATASIFQSKYKGGDGVERNTRFSRNYVCNILGGKEWQIGKNGKNNIGGINARLYFMGGERYIPLKEQETLAAKENIYDYRNSFSKHYSPSYRLDITLTYRRNHPKYSGVWSLQFLNVLGSPDREGFQYNFHTNSIKEHNVVYQLPVLGYKIEF